MSEVGAKHFPRIRKNLVDLQHFSKNDLTIKNSIIFTLVVFVHALGRNICEIACLEWNWKLQVHMMLISAPAIFWVASCLMLGRPLESWDQAVTRSAMKFDEYMKCYVFCYLHFDDRVHQFKDKAAAMISSFASMFLFVCHSHRGKSTNATSMSD